MNSLSHLPLSCGRFAPLDAVAAFINQESGGQEFDDGRLEDFLRALVLLDWNKDNKAFVPDKQTRRVPPSLPRAYALLKLLFLSEGKLQLKPSGEVITVKHEPSVVPLLRAGRAADALEVAERRLTASGLIPLAKDFFFPREDGARLAAALLIPVDEPSVCALARLVLHKQAEDQPTDET